MSMNDNTKKLSQAIKPLLVATGDVVIPKAEVFEATLPEGMTMENVLAVQAHQQAFMAGFTHAVGEVAVNDILANHKEVDLVSANVALGMNTGQVIVKRQSPTIGPDGATGVDWGTTHTTFVNGGGEEIRKAQDVIGKLAMNVLSKME